MSGGIGGRLTDKACKAFMAQDARGKKLSDGEGLHLFITPAGGATWRIKYRIDGKEKIYSIGPYPAVSLAAARVELTEVKALLREHKDPVTQRRINRAETNASSDDTFEVVAGKWLSMKKKEWSEGHLTKSSRAFERDIYPAIGKLRGLGSNGTGKSVKDRLICTRAEAHHVQQLPAPRTNSAPAC